MSVGALGPLYAAGFVLATGLLHLVGIALAKGMVRLNWDALMRWIGVGVSLAGVALVFM
ncbi:MAG: HupE/UreJ family protein [Aliidongia sp.]